jgi:hypothetical protein
MVKDEDKDMAASGDFVIVEEIEGYLKALDKCKRILPTKPPRIWNEARLQEARAKAKIIMNRLNILLSEGGRHEDKTT